jgi:CRISPR-associated protein Cas6
MGGTGEGAGGGMSSEEGGLGDVADVVFALNGHAVAEDYAELLWLGLREVLPWLAEDAVAGVHPLSGTSPGQGEQYLSRRSRLVLRLAVDRIDAARALSGARLDLGGTVEVGAATVRALGVARTLYSPFVDVGITDEEAFLAECRRRLADMAPAAKLIAGKARALRAEEGIRKGFSLMLHGLGADDSLRIQHSGLGEGRKRGCGVFVPHKSVVAVSDQ